MKTSDGKQKKGRRKKEVETQELPNLYTAWMGLLVRVMNSGQTQIDYTEESEVSVLVTFQQRLGPLWIPVPADLRVLVLVSAHPKLRSFVRLCAWSILSLGPKPPLAHYPAFIVCLATNLFKK